jgi:hypothetical protein
VIDATGVGEGLWAMLDRRYPQRVIPVKFSAQKKSELGYRFLAMIETGRFQDCTLGGRAPGPEADAAGHVQVVTSAGVESAGLPGITASMVDKQYAACVSEVLTGPQKLMRWGVPEGTRDPDGALIHDDILMADALLAEADLLDWAIHFSPTLSHPDDPLEGMSHFGG